MRSTEMVVTSRDERSIIQLPSFLPLEEEIQELALSVETPAICDSSVEDVHLDPAIVGLTSGRKVVGPALPVRLPPGENLLLHIAIRLVRSGEVLVVTAGQAVSWASPFGELMRTGAETMGAAGIVLDGFIRDRSAIAEGHFPVFARGACPKACNKAGGGSIGIPVDCGGRLVRPGDVVVADENGVVVINRERALETLRAAREKMNAEVERKASIAKGAISPAFVEERIRMLGLEKLLDWPEWSRNRAT